MKVVYVAPAASLEFCRKYEKSSGSGLAGFRKVALIAEGLASLGHQVLILSSYICGASRFERRALTVERLTDSVQIVYPSTVSLRPWGSLLSWMHVGSTVRKVVAEFGPDSAIVYNCHVYECLAIRELLRSAGRIPVVLEIEDLPHARRRDWMNVKPHLDQFCWGAMTKAATAFTAVNESILERIPAGKQSVLLPGVIDERLIALSEKRTPAFCGDEFKLGYFGGLSIGKGTEILIEAVPMLPENWKVIVSGSGPMAPRLNELAERWPGRLKFLGCLDTEQLYEALCSCDCCIIPREKVADGGKSVFPFKTLEYAVSGTHIVASGLPEFRSIDLSWIRTWDGSAKSLIGALSTAKKDYETHRVSRIDSIREVKSRYSSNAVALLLADLMRPEDQREADHTPPDVVKGETQSA
jgi:glycosyltransferase involved in cell wall biosynthesis